MVILAVLWPPRCRPAQMRKVCYLMSRLQASLALVRLASASLAEARGDWRMSGFGAFLAWFQVVTLLASMVHEQSNISEGSY